MFNTDTELLFPVRVIPFLGNLRGQEWQQLIRALVDKNAEDLDVVAFSALIAKIGGCSGCNADSFRAMRGCTQCARITIRRNKNTDNELIEMYNHIRQDVEEFLNKRK